MSRLNIAVLTDRSALYVAPLLLETLKSGKIKFDKVYLRKKAVGGKEKSSLLSVLRQSGWNYFFFRALGLLKLKFTDWFQTVFLRRPVEERPCLGIDELCKRYDLPIAYIEDVNGKEFIDQIQARKIDVILCAFYSQILRSEIINAPLIGCLNVHPSLLPRFAGTNPVYWVLAEGEKEAGGTIHLIDEGIDTGPRIAQCKVTISASDTQHSLYLRIILRLSKVLRDVLIEIQNSGKIEFLEGDNSDRSYYSRPTPESFRMFRKSGRRFF